MNKFLVDNSIKLVNQNDLIVKSNEELKEKYDKCKKREDCLCSDFKKSIKEHNEFIEKLCFMSSSQFRSWCKENRNETWRKIQQYKSQLDKMMFKE